MDNKRPTESAKKVEAVLLQGFASVGQRHLADLVLVEESTVSRLKTDEPKINLLALAMMIDAMGLKLVPRNFKTFRAEDIDPYIQLAKRHMATVGSADDLAWNGVE